MTKALYLLGGPGSGKSTLMSHLLKDWAVGPYERLTQRELFGHALVGPDLERGLYLGHLRPEYPGTDALSLSVAPQAQIWLDEMDHELDWVFGEGTRLGHLGFLGELHKKTELVVVYLLIDETLARIRRMQRPGKELSERYCKQTFGKATNAANQCVQAGIQVRTMNAAESVEVLANELLAYF